MMAQMASVVDEPSGPVAERPPKSAPVEDLGDPFEPDDAADQPSDGRHVAPESLPVIAVEGVNADDRGFTYRLEDFSTESSSESTEPIVTNPEDGTLLRRSGSVAARRYSDASTIDAVSPDPASKAASGKDSGGNLPQPASQRRSYRAPVARKERSGRWKAWLVAVVLIVLVGSVGAYVTYDMELWGGKTVPSVVGRTQTDAVYKLEQSGFTVVTTLVKSDATEGIVLSQSPSADSKASRGSEVVIRVSAARTVPEVIGLSRSEAVTLLEEEGVFNVVVTTQKSDEQAGTVLAVSPEVGEKIEATTTVTITVATPYTVPDVTGMTAEDAQATLEEEGYSVVFSYVYDETVESGCVVSTDREAGAVLAIGSTVTVYVARSLAEELVEATYDYLNGLDTIELSGTTFEIVSVDGVTYASDYTLAFTITAHAVTWLDGEQVTASDRQVNATIIWDEDGNVVQVF